MVSKIWKISNTDFKELIESSKTYKEALEKIGMLTKSGGSYKTLKARIEKEQVDVSHIEAAKKRFRGIQNEQRPLDEILTKDSNYKSSDLKRRLIKEGLLKNKCSECKLGDVWCNKPISLQLDHINGNHDDNRLENLRILCPNCHSQTKTFGRKNFREKKRSYFCECGNKKSKQSKTCRSCVPKDTKIVWPTNNVLIMMISHSSRLAVSKKLGVSETAVRKRLAKIRAGDET